MRNKCGDIWLKRTRRYGSAGQRKRIMKQIGLYKPEKMLVIEKNLLLGSITSGPSQIGLVLVNNLKE